MINKKVETTVGQAFSQSGLIGLVSKPLRCGKCGKFMALSDLMAGYGARRITYYPGNGIKQVFICKRCIYKKAC